MNTVNVILESTPMEGAVERDFTHCVIVCEVLNSARPGIDNPQVVAHTEYPPTADRKVKGRRSKYADGMMFCLPIIRPNA